MGDSYELRITSPTGNDWFQWIVLVTEFYNELGAEFGLQNHKGLIIDTRLKIQSPTAYISIGIKLKNNLNTPIKNLKK